MNRAFSNLLCSDPQTAAAFYETLLGMHRQFDSDWFVVLTHPNRDGFELGLLQRTHQIVPNAVQAAPAGIMLTFVVDDTDVIHKRAIEAGVTVLEQPIDMPYGQRRMLLQDPEGTIVDISAPTAPLQED